jgi:Arc/MetJ-type ribon-helix-helix transcriptional regulator
MADTEKITINMSVVDLGKVDLLVEEGFYSNRTDFIRAAIRYQLNRHEEVVQESAVRKSMVLGVLTYNRAELMRFQQQNEKVACRVVGMLHIADDIDAELARATVESIKVLGVFKASQAIKEALADRIL